MRVCTLLLFARPSLWLDNHPSSMTRSSIYFGGGSLFDSHGTASNYCTQSIAFVPRHNAGSREDSAFAWWRSAIFYKTLVCTRWNEWCRTCHTLCAIIDECGRVWHREKNQNGVAESARSSSLYATDSLQWCYKNTFKFTHSSILIHIYHLRLLPRGFSLLLSCSRNVHWNRSARLHQKNLVFEQTKWEMNSVHHNSGEMKCSFSIDPLGLPRIGSDVTVKPGTSEQINVLGWCRFFMVKYWPSTKMSSFDDALYFRVVITS